MSADTVNAIVPVLFMIALLLLIVLLLIETIGRVVLRRQRIEDLEQARRALALLERLERKGGDR